MALNYNFDKTKILIFGTGQDLRFDFNLGGHKIDIHTDFKYLCVICSRNRHFQQSKKHNFEQAWKAMHVLFKRIRNLNIPFCLAIFFYLLHYMVVRYGALEKVKLMKIYIIITQTDCWFEKRYPNFSINLDGNLTVFATLIPKATSAIWMWEMYGHIQYIVGHMLQN